MRITALLLMIASLAIAHADDRKSPEARAKFKAELRAWAQTYYPSLMNAKRLPTHITLGFLVDSKGVVHAHSVGFPDAPVVNVTDQLALLFPQYPKSAFGIHGMGCFEGPPPYEPPYCVVFARMER